MNSTRDQRASSPRTSESAMDERGRWERRLQRRRERERAHRDSETVEQSEERMRVRTELGALLRLSNKEHLACNNDVTDWPPNQPQ